LFALAGEPKTKKTRPPRKDSVSPLSQSSKQEEELSLEVIVLLPDSPLELRKLEASKPLYITRYE
jgi:hypothetical protein